MRFTSVNNDVHDGRDPGSRIPDPVVRTSVLLGPFELFPIRLSLSPDLVDADGILAPLPKQFGHPGTQVLVEIEFHGRVTASEGC